MEDSQYTVLSLHQKLSIGISIGSFIFVVIFVAVGVLEIIDRKKTELRKREENERVNNLEVEFKQIFKGVHADNKVTITEDGVKLKVPDLASQTSLLLLHSKRLKEKEKGSKSSFKLSDSHVHMPRRRGSKGQSQSQGDIQGHSEMALTQNCQESDAPCECPKQDSDSKGESSNDKSVSITSCYHSESTNSDIAISEA